MSVRIDRRDAFAYAEGRRLAERERGIAMRALWDGIREWVSQALNRSGARPRHIGTKTEPSKEKTSSPCWFTPVFSEKTMPVRPAEQRPVGF